MTQQPKLRVGLIGIGFMGWIHHLAYLRSRSAKVTAVATRDPKKQVGDWTSIRGNFGPPGGHVDLSDVAVFSDWQSLIQSTDIDAVDICLPPALHREVAIAAMAAGKHVFCEKPIALTTSDAQAMLNASERYQRTLSIAHVLPFMEPFRYIFEKSLSGEFGDVRSMNLKRIISDPAWIPDFYDPRTVGGPMIDLHIHDAHFIQLLCGLPKDITACGWLRGDVVEYAQMLYRFQNPNVVASASSGVCTSSARMFTHGIEVQFEKAAMNYELSVHSGGATTFGAFLYGQDGSMMTLDLPVQDDVDAFVREIDLFASSVHGLNDPCAQALSAKLACNAVSICEAVECSVKSQSTVAISPVE